MVQISAKVRDNTTAWAAARRKAFHSLAALEAQ